MGLTEDGGLGRDYGSMAKVLCLFAFPPAARGWRQLLFWGPAMGNAGSNGLSAVSQGGGVEHWPQHWGSCLLCLLGRASLHDKASLRLEQVRSEDQGWYECKVLMLDQQYDTFHNGSWVHLTINGEYQPPSPGGGSCPGSLLSEGVV